MGMNIEKAKEEVLNEISAGTSNDTTVGFGPRIVARRSISVTSAPPAERSERSMVRPLASGASGEADVWDCLEKVLLFILLLDIVWS